MTIHVESCWGGVNRLYFRLSWGGHRATINGEVWSRSLASQALDLLEHCYGLTRRNVRFKVH